MITKTLIHYVLKAAIRDRLVVTMIAAMVLGCSLSIFLGSSAVVEQDQFSLAFASAGLRLTGMIGIVLFIVFFIRRSIDSRDMEFLLSRPVGRMEFLLSYAAAFSIIAIIVTLAQTLGLYILGPHLFGEGAILWCFSVMIENIIVANTAFFFALFLSSAASASLAVLGFYVLGRMMGQILGIVQAGGNGQIAELLGHVMNMIAMVMPRLDLIGQTSWLIYGPQGDVGLIFLIIQGVIFSTLVLTLALIDLTRKQF